MSCGGDAALWKIGWTDAGGPPLTLIELLGEERCHRLPMTGEHRDIRIDILSVRPLHGLPMSHTPSITPCQRSLQEMTPETVGHLLDMAGEERWRQKANRFALRAERRGVEQALYESLGFVKTGEVAHGEEVMRLRFEGEDQPRGL